MSASSAVSFPKQIYLRYIGVNSGNGVVSSIRQLYPQYKPLPMFLSLMLVACTIYRVSAFPSYIGSWSGKIAMLGQYGLLVASTLYLLAVSSGRMLPVAVLLPLSTLISCFTTGDLTQAGIRWLGWLMLYISVGPLIQSAKAIQFRENLWRTWRILIIPIAVGSLAPYFGLLPRVGRGHFSGLMGHSMLLAPIAAMAAVMAVVYARQVDRRRGGILLACITLSCFFSGSRSAMVCGLAAALATFLLTGRRITSSAALLLLPCLLLGLAYPSISEFVQGTETGQYLQKKGTRNTRARLWETRINEFKAYPLFGLGINMAMEVEDDGLPGEKDTRAGIESGSSWLSFLSMTGLAGSMSYLLLILSIVVGFVRRWGRLNPYLRAEAAGMVFFVCLHTIFEGYALAFGSPLSLIFWLAWGRMADLQGINVSQ